MKARILPFLPLAAAFACGAPAHRSACPTTDRALPAANSNGPAAPGIDVAALERLAATRSYSLGTPRPVRITPDGNVLFLRTTRRSFNAELFEFDARTGSTSKLASADELLEGAGLELSAAEKALRERTRTALRGIVSVEVSDDGRTVLLPLGEKVFAVDRATKGHRQVDVGTGYPDAVSLSPDGKFLAFVRDQDLWVVGTDGKGLRRVTKHERDSVTYGMAEFVAQEELDRTRGHWWSPDGRTLLIERADEATVDTLHVSNPAAPERDGTAFRYPRAGRPNADVSLHLVPRSGGRSVPVAWDRAAFPYVRAVDWPEHAPPTVVVMNRAQTKATVLAVDPKSGETTTLVTEEDPAWVNVPEGPLWFADGSRFLWASERTGVWQLEVHAADGALLRSVALPGFDGGIQIDQDAGEVWLSGSEDPTSEHVARLASLDASPAWVTTDAGVHSVVVGRHGGTRVQIDAAPNGARTWTVVDRSGKALGTLESVAEAPPNLPNVTLETVTLDTRTHHTAIVRPRDFDPSRKYPVVLQVYAGPGVTTVWNTPRAYFKDQILADTGFIVVRSDGRGTPRRGRDWERVTSRDLITVPIADQVAALEALGARHPELDLDRVGVMGWSFGGYFSAMAALRRPDRFKAAIAGAPVTDWRFYDTAYTERYMGLPEENTAAYDATSAVVHAGELTRPLLLVHGFTDDNVYVVNTLALEDALFRAHKDYELITLGSTHMTVDPQMEAALLTREVHFFRKHLGVPASTAISAPAP
ncbi:MAG: prolyl oligopeptidase family serine peptidase [Polyangiales bacterium]